MKIVLVYISPNPTTQKIARLIEEHLTKLGHEAILLNIGRGQNRRLEDMEFTPFSDADILGIGCPVYHMTLIEPMEKFMRFALPKISEIKAGIAAFAFFTYSGITTGKALQNASALLRSAGIPFIGAAKIAAPHFYQTDYFPNQNAAATVSEFCEGMHSKNFSPMDTEKADRVAKDRKTVINILYPFAHFIGKLRQQNFSISSEACIACGKCAAECPTEAIMMKPHASRDPKACVYCYHCGTVCPVHAVGCDPEEIKRAVKLNKKIVGTEDPTNAVYL